MLQLDIRTILFTFILTAFLCAFIMYLSYRENGSRFRGFIHWILCYSMIGTGYFLIALRGLVPDIVSMGVANIFIMIGVFLMLVGFCKFLGIEKRNYGNYFLLAIFSVLQVWFSVVQPDLVMRTLNISVAALILFFQAATLTLFYNDENKITRNSGFVFVVFAVLNLIRVIDFFLNSSTSYKDFFNSGILNSVINIAFQLLLMLLTYTVILMVNKRLVNQILAKESELIQAQKMESIGRLAGGVAHDFNNMLSVIIGRSEMALNKVDKFDPVHKELTHILSAAEKSADITSQLLAFARKQLIRPETININESISKMKTILKSITTEGIVLNTEFSENLWKTKIDPSQVDQILVNLIVNAKDSLADKGEIKIKTENVSVTNPDLRKTPGLKKGEFVCLAVSDNGHGMDEETLKHIFEPFFTTKEVGKGTGLGLSTVYGIVKQNEGYVYAESTPQKGSEFKVYFPKIDEQAEK